MWLRKTHWRVLKTDNQQIFRTAHVQFKVNSYVKLALTVM